MGLCQEQGACTPSHRAVHPALPGPGCCPNADPAFPAPSVPLGQQQLVQPHTLGPQRHRLWGPRPPRVGLQPGPAAGSPPQPYMVRSRSPGPLGPPSPTEHPPGAVPAAGPRCGGRFPSARLVPLRPRLDSSSSPGAAGNSCADRRPPSSPPHPSPAPASSWHPRPALGSHRPHARRGMGPELR